MPWGVGAFIALSQKLAVTVLSELTGVSGPKSKNGVRTVTECVRTSRYSSVKLLESPVNTGVFGPDSPSKKVKSGDQPDPPASPGTGVSGEHRRLRSLFSLNKKIKR